MRIKRRGKKVVSRKQKNPYAISFRNAHPLIAAAYDRSLTLKQNYARMGLVANLNGSTGGAEGQVYGESVAGVSDVMDGPSAAVEWRESIDASDPAPGLTRATEEEAGIEGPFLSDPLLSTIGVKLGVKRTQQSKSVSGSKGKSGDASTLAQQITQALEQEAASVLTLPRATSSHEELILEALFVKYGEDYDAMARDRKLNRMQQSAGHLRRRLKRVMANANLIQGL